MTEEQRIEQRERETKYREAHREKHQERMRKYWSKNGKLPQNDIYSRVRKFNRGLRVKILRLQGGLRVLMERWKIEDSRFSVGCSLEAFKDHIESLFHDNSETGEPMTWENNGQGAQQWQFDHIIPAKEFDLTDPEQLKAFCHFTNLRPLWKREHGRTWRRAA